MSTSSAVNFPGVNRAPPVGRRPYFSVDRRQLFSFGRRQSFFAATAFAAAFAAACVAAMRCSAMYSRIRRLVEPLV